LKEVRAAFEKINEGEIYEGIVTVVAGFGCFVRIEVPVSKGERVGVEGLVHISELSWGKVDRVDDIAREGDKVSVKVVGKREDRLALSIKQAKGDPWRDAAKKYKKDDKVKGKVVRVSDFGVFVELEEGIEGLIHITKIPPGQKLEIGKEVNVYVEEIDPEVRKLSLGLVLTTKPLGYK
jgi:ribosomal protein S1